MERKAVSKIVSRNLPIPIPKIEYYNNTKIKESSLVVKVISKTDYYPPVYTVEILGLNQTGTGILIDARHTGSNVFNIGEIFIAVKSNGVWNLVGGSGGGDTSNHYHQMFLVSAS